MSEAERVRAPEPNQRGPLEMKPPGTGAEPDSSVDEQQQAECVSDVVTPPPAGRCTCAYTDCDASALECSCDVDCYSGADCGINCTGTGATFDCTSSGDLAGCALTCTEEGDLTETLECTVSDCAADPNVAVFEPSPSTSPDVLEVDRQIRNSDVLVTIDSSGSMQDKQRNMSCAIDAFASQLSSAAEYSVGIVSQNTTCYEDSSGVMNGLVPPLIGLEDPSCAQVPCACAEGEDVEIPCSFNLAGSIVTESTPGGLELLKRRMVIGEFNDETSCGGDENGDEAQYTPIVQRALAAIAMGKAAPSVAITASDESADDDQEACKWVAQNYAANRARFTSVLVGFAPPALTGDCHQDLANFYSYFFTTYGCDHDPDGDGTINPEVPNSLGSGSPCTRVYSLCDPDECDIQTAVTRATGGSTWDIYQCPYDQFFAQIGFSTSTLSTAICNVDVGDVSTLVVTYLGNGTSEVVPNVSVDGANGWSYAPDLGCLDFHGHWAAVEGRFRIEHGTSSPGTERLCFAPGVQPIVSSIVVRYQSATGPVVPQSGADGWAFDVTSDCFDFFGSWAQEPRSLGPFHVEYLDASP